MALTTYSELQAAVAARLNRSDTATYVADWITVAENEICRWLRVSWTEKRAEATPTSAFVQLPSDFNGIRNIQWDYQNYRIPLEQVSPDLLDKVNPSTLVGTPAFFAIHDEQIELRPAPASDNTTTVEISYYFKPAALSDANTSNEILVNAPDLLFYRVLAEGFDHYFDEQRAGKYMALYERAKRDIFDEEKKLSWGRGVMRAHADSLRGM